MSYERIIITCKCGAIRFLGNVVAAATYPIDLDVVNCHRCGHGARTDGALTITVLGMWEEQPGFYSPERASPPLQYKETDQNEEGRLVKSAWCTAFDL